MCGPTSTRCARCPWVSEAPARARPGGGGPWLRRALWCRCRGWGWRCAASLSLAGQTHRPAASLARARGAAPNTCKVRVEVVKTLGRGFSTGRFASAGWAPGSSRTTATLNSCVLKVRARAPLPRPPCRRRVWEWWLDALPLCVLPC